jgi:hypothetical protein
MLLPCQGILCVILGLRNEVDENCGVKNLKMRPIGCPETSVRFYLYSLRKNPQKRSSRVKELHEEVVLSVGPEISCFCEPLNPLSLDCEVLRAVVKIMAVFWGGDFLSLCGYIRKLQKNLR